MAVSFAIILTPAAQPIAPNVAGWVPGATGPLVINEYPTDRWEDITGQDSSRMPSSPNAYLILARYDDVTLDAIEADTRFHVLIARSKTDAGRPTLAEFDALRARLGLTRAQLRAIASDTLTRSQIAGLLIQWLRNRPKG